MIEYEIKILDIDMTAAHQRLIELGYSRHAERAFRRVIFDVTPRNENKWVRLRTDGRKTTLTYKNFKTDAIDGVEEVEVEVEGFDSCRQLLELAGLQSTSYQENRRIDYVGPSGSVEISIDTWPGLPSYMEVEGTSVDAVNSAVERLGLGSHRQTSATTKEIYKMYGLSIDGKKELRFE